MDALLLLKKAIKESKAYTDQAIEAIAGGLHYKGSVPTKDNLPLSGNKQGDMYTTDDTGHEWVWTIKESSGTLDDWLDLNKELVNYYKKSEVDTLLANLKTELDTKKLDVLPKVDDPTDPGFGWEYHIPYRFDVSLDAEKADIDLHTLTLDNKVTKMVFNKQVPSATQSTAGLLSASDKVKVDNAQPKLTAGTNITIDENNVISASGGEFDEKTIVKGADNKYQTAIGGWKETTPEQLTNLFIDSKGDGTPTYFGPDSSSIKYDVGWDYNPTITSLVSGVTTATINTKFTVLGTTFNGSVTLTKSPSIPANWESDYLTIGGNLYKIKIGDGWVGVGNGGISVIGNPSLDLSTSTMESLALVTGSPTVVYHPIDNKFLKLDDSLDVDDNNALNVNTEVIQSKLTAGTNIIIDENNVISSTGEAAIQCIELEGWDESEGWHDGGTLTADQVQVLTVNELNYIWMNGMHRLDFRYRDNANNLATYSSSDGVKSHVIEIQLSTKTWRYTHQMLADKESVETETTERETADQLLDTKIDTLDASLVPIAKSGNIKDLVQDETDVLILDCNV